MKTVIGLLSAGLFLFCISCNEKEQSLQPANNEIAYFIFGHFYGECGGEGCVEIFKLEDEKLFEDTTDVYPTWMAPFNGTYISLPQEKFELVKDLVEYFPEELYEETGNVIGQPDAADWGGIYVEIKYVEDEEKSGFWLLDQNTSNMPDVYNAFVARINEKIMLINQ